MLEVSDNGRGIAKQEILKSNSVGLLGMCERLEPWGGNVHVSGRPNQGTRITVTVSKGDDISEDWISF